MTRQKLPLQPRRIPLTEAATETHENVDGHPFGAVFDIFYSTEHHFMGDLWGFGETKEAAIRNLVEITEEYNALYLKQNLRFIPTYWGITR